MVSRIRLALACSLFLTLSGSFTSLVCAQRPLNLDFARASVAYADRPWGWSLGWSSFDPRVPASFSLDSTQRVQGRRSLRITATDTGASSPLRAMALQLPAEFARGSVLRLTGAMRGGGRGGRALVQLEAWMDRAVGAADTAVLPLRERRGEWQRFTLTIRPPNEPAVHSIYIAVGVEGSGTAWFADLALSRDGIPLSVLPADDVPPVTAPERAWLAARSAPLSRVTPEAASSNSVPPDLALVSRVVGNARIVALGESTHGTHEFFTMKHRLLEHFVRRLDFDVFAIEGNQLAVERLNAYVHGAPGTAREAMRSLFRVWNTEEMLALVEWVRGHNATHPARPVRFIGYDMQDHQTPVDSLEAFVRRVEPAYLARLRRLTESYRSQASYATPQQPEARRRAWGAALDTLWVEVSGRRAQWLAPARSRADTLAVEWAIHDADLVRQAARMNVTLNSPDRDSLMAANLDWAMRTLYPTSRVVAWAHDVHVSHGGDSARSFNGGAQMGAYLKHAFGYDYRAFSLLTRTGRYSATRSFTDRTIASMQAFPAPAGSVEALLGSLPRSAGSPGLVTDLRVVEGDGVGRFLWRARPVRHIGYAAYDYGFDLRAVMPLEFDAVVFIDRTEPSRMLVVTGK
ncbi:MAG: erythromycin esterase family protein [Gemmatimonadaceae bacterium]|nr:erythromycin esterase family protein [Gemmatimonadaceae bacterium]